MKTKKTRFISLLKSFFKKYGLIIIIIVSIMFLANWGMLFLMESEKENIDFRQQDLVEQEFNTIDFIVSTGITNTHNDLHVIRDADETTSFISNPINPNLEILEQLIYRIATNKPEFLAISLINPSGNEILKIINDNNELIILEASELENVSNNPEHNIANSLVVNEMYISPISINEVDIPTIDFMMGLFDSSDNLLYYLKINYNANYLLSIFREYQNSDINFIDLGLINDNNLWKIETQTDDIDIFVPTELPEDFSSNESSIFTHNLQISEMFEHNIYNDDDFLIIYANINYQGAYDEYGSYLLKHPIVLYLINILIFFGTLGLALIIKSKNENRLLLNANMYLSDKNKDGVMITDSDFKITYINEAFTNIYGYQLLEIEGQTPYDIFNIHQFKIDPKTISANNIFEKNIWNNSKSGIFILKHLRIRPETTAGGRIKHFVEIFSEPKLNTNLVFDKDLNANSKELKLLVDVFSHLDYNPDTSCFIVIKLYNEKDYKNSTMKSREKYNEYILAKFLRMKMDNSYHIASPGFGYTIIYSENITNKVCIDKLEFLFNKYKQISIINPQLEYHFGISSESIKANSKTELFYQALLALEMAIKQKNTKHLVYDEEIKKLLDREKVIYHQLDYAFKNKEFYLDYQIQYNCKEDKFFGAEALLRWNNKILGNIYPNEFIPIIENSFYVNQLSLMVIELVINDFEPYINDFDENFRISINLTAFDFLSEYIIKDILSIIESSKIEPKHFCFEITESGYLTNKEKANELIAYLKSKNIQVAIDDFGTGFSAIGILKDINVDMVKIDRSFILKYPEFDDGLMFKSLTNLVHNLGIELLVEGVETKKQLELSKENHCQYVQGFYFSKPLSIKEFIKKYKK